jgi:excisionase family DNA binding protein
MDGVNRGGVRTVQLPDDRPFYTVTEAAEVVRCSERTIYRYIRDGTIDAKQGPTQKLIARDSLQGFIDTFPDVGGAY